MDFVLSEIAPHQLPHTDDFALCRSHGHKDLCDGFVCELGKECASGCCGQFANLKEEFCLPQLDDKCIAHGFHYGPFGLNFDVPEKVTFPLETPEPRPPGTDETYELE